MKLASKGLKWMLGRFGYELRRPVDARGIAIEASAQDQANLQVSSPFTMTSPERLWALVNAVGYVVEADIPGDFVECGVWRGGSAMAMAGKLLSCGVTRRDIWLYDTFQGMSPPCARDKEARTGYLAKTLMENSSPDESDGVWCVASVDEVKSNIEIVGYPAERFRFVEGDVSETLSTHVPDEIALLRLDTDWYESTRKELEVLYPRLARGGVCIIDDYGHWQGARQAVDEYLQRNNLRVLLHRIDDTGRIFVKP